VATIKKFFPALLGIVALAGLLGTTASCGNSPETAGKLSAAAAAADMKKLLNVGAGETSEGYFQKTSQTLVAAAAGTYNSRFYDLGRLMVEDGLSHAMIALGREMNGTWYEWNEHRAPPSEPDAFIKAWRQIVTTMRSVPGQHFKFLWTIFMDSAAVADCWPGSKYVDYIGTDIFDWYGGPRNTYPHTASGALDHASKWQQIVSSAPGGLNWTAAFSEVTGKPIVIPEWGLDFHTFGGQDDPQFITNMMAWMKDHHAIGLYWGGSHISPAAAPGGPLLVGQGEASQNNTPAIVGGMGQLMGGRLEYAGAYLSDSKWPSASTARTVLATWQHEGYRLILSVPLVPNPPVIKSYSGPPEPGDRPYQLADYPDVVAALRQGR